jgi:malonyl-CoA O-methyltransferase
MPPLSAPDKRLMRRAFERAAQSYDGAAGLQRDAGVRLAARLDVLVQAPQCILDAGSGTGHGAALLGERYADAHIVAIDIAHAMVLAARRKRAAAAGVCGDIERLPLIAGAFDLVWSNMALQWCTQLPLALRELSRVLRPGGWLLLSTLGPDTLRELREAFGGVDGHSHVNRFTDRDELATQLRHAGFAAQIECKPATLRYASVREVMQDLKAIGAHNVTGGRPAGLMGKAKWRQVEQNYERLRADGCLPATYEVIYVAAQRS